MDWAGLFWLFSIWSWFCINFSGSSFPGGNKKHCSPLRLGVVVPCHEEGSGMTLPSQCTQPLGRSPSVWCSGKPDIKLASGTHGIIVPTGMSDNEVVGSKGSKNLECVNLYILIAKVLKQFDYALIVSCQLNIDDNLPSFGKDMQDTSSAILSFIDVQISIQNCFLLLAMYPMTRVLCCFSKSDLMNSCCTKILKMVKGHFWFPIKYQSAYFDSNTVSKRFFKTHMYNCIISIHKVICLFFFF